MGRKFTFKITPLKVTSSAVSPAVETPPVIEFMEPPSPPFVPDSPLFEPREPLSPAVERELRSACAVILRALKPSGQIYEDLAKSEYSEAQALRNAQSRTRAKGDIRPTTRPLPSEGILESYRPKPPGPQNRLRSTSNTSTYKHVPQHAAAAFVNTAIARQPSITRGTSSSESQRAATFSQEVEARLAQLASQDVRRPTTAGSAGRDASYASSHPSPSSRSTIDPTFSRSTSRTTDPAFEQTSGEFSAELAEIHPAFRPNVEASVRASFEQNGRTSTDVFQRPPSRRSRIAEYIRPSSAQANCNHLQRSSSRTSFDQPVGRPPSRSRIAEYIRPSSAQSNYYDMQAAPPTLSRSSSRSRIAEYIRPSSSHSQRSTRTTDSSSSTTAGTWWRPLLSSRKSSSSLRRDKADQQDRDGADPNSPQLDLNRALPPLPSLSTWEEPRKHIANLMRPGQVVEPPLAPTSNSKPATNGLPHDATGASAPMQQKTPLGPLNPNVVAERPPVLPRTRTKERWKGRMNKEVLVESVGVLDEKKSAGECEAADKLGVGMPMAPSTSASASGATKFGRLRKQLSRLTMGVGDGGQGQRVGF